MGNLLGVANAVPGLRMNLVATNAHIDAKDRALDWLDAQQMCQRAAHLVVCQSYFDASRLLSLDTAIRDDMSLRSAVQNA